MSKYILKNTPGGKKTLIYKNSKEIKLHSSYNPDIEALRAVEKFECGRAKIIIVAGLGLAYHIARLKEKFPESSVIAIERDREVIEIAEQVSTSYLEGVEIINSIKDLPGIFEALDMGSFSGASYFYHRPSYMLDQPFYDNMIKEINIYFSSKLSDLLTRFEFEERWVENILLNVHKLSVAKRVSGLFGRFKNYPGIIVSAGPSLRKNIKLLGKISEKALIVSVDTALKVLQRNNISPHIVMTLDSQKYSIKHFLGLKNHGPVLLADIVSYPRILDLYRGNKVVSTTSKFYTDSSGQARRETTSIMEWIEKYIKPVGDIQSGGNVASSIFDLLLNLGCNPIILVGQDLAYTGREIHCSGTYHNDGWLPETTRFTNLDTKNQLVIRKRKIKYVEAFGGSGTVISDFVFDLYKNWFADSAARIPVQVINATEGGARIKNTIEKSLGSLIESMPASGKPPGDILQKALNEPGIDDDFKSLISGVALAIEELLEINNFAKENSRRNDFNDFDTLEQMINKEYSSLIIKTYLKKTNIYLTRHNFVPEKACAILLSEIATASEKALKVLTKCKENLKKIR